MKLFFTILILNLFLSLSLAQNDPPDIVEGNSCKSRLKITHPGLKYSYDNSTQTLDYSNNWDFDGDGYYDSLFFIGTGEAHLYFYLRLVLSFDSIVIDFPFLELDMPWLNSISALENAKFYPPSYLPMFAVHNFDRDMHYEIYLHLDRSLEVSEEWKKRGVSSRYLLLDYENGEIIIKNFID